MTTTYDQDKVQEEFYKGYTPKQKVQPSDESEIAKMFECRPIHKLITQTKAQSRTKKYMNADLLPYVGKVLEGYVVDITYHKQFNCVIRYDLMIDGKVVCGYDLMEVPGVSKETNLERKLRYMRTYGTRGKTFERAKTNGVTLASSLGALWAAHARLCNKRIKAYLKPFLSESGFVYFAMLSSELVYKVNKENV